MSELVIAGQALPSRLFLGTGGLPNVALLGPVLDAARPALVTVSMRRTSSLAEGGLLAALRDAGTRLLPNTAGCLSAREAVLTAELAREALGTDWVKLEVVGDEHTLLPDAVELLDAAEEWGMDALVEVHDQLELDRALALHAEFIGINNRNLRTFETTLDTSIRLAGGVPPKTLLVSESGILSHDHVELLHREAGIGTFLVGESLMRQPDVAAATRALLHGVSEPVEG